MFRTLPFLALLLFPATSWAGDTGDVAVTYKTVVQGNDRPALILTPTDSVKKAALTLVDDLGKKQTARAGAIRAGAKKTLSFRQGEGTRRYTGKLVVHWRGGGSSSFDLDFEATRVGPLKIFISAETVDIEARKLSCTITNPARELELKILGKDGGVLETITEVYDPPERAGEALIAEWPEIGEDILRMDLKVTDIGGFFVVMHITPFTIQIPHEEVVFETGRAQVRPSEEPKLAATMGHITKALKQHGTLLSLKLFVAGYTDTVGGSASNLELSNRRAKAIAAWFRRHGLKIPIYYQGFGESVLAVPTPDETEEARNRRALYILSSHVPSGDDVPRNAWRRL